MDVKLLIQTGRGSGLEVPVRSTEFLIGGDPLCQLRIDHEGVGRRHCRIYRQAGRLLAEDLRTAGGTTYNDRPIRAPVEIEDGGRLGIGSTRLLVSIATSGLLAERVEDGPDPDSPLARKAREILDRVSGQGTTAESDPRPVAPSPKKDMDTDQVGSEPGPERGGDYKVEGAEEGPIRVEHHRGVAVVELLDYRIVDSREIDGLSEGIEALIAGGDARIVLDFRGVEFLSSQAVGTVINAHKRCVGAGGALKLAGLRTQVAEIFRLMRLDRMIDIHTDARSALAARWPEATAARAPEAEAEAEARPAVATASGPESAPAPASTSTLQVRLIVGIGRAEGKAIAVPGPRFVVGRDPRCQLRPNSPAISRLHAIIERREGKVIVRDLGTRNGTILNDRALHGEEAEARDGDRLQIGPLQFRFSIEGGGPPLNPMEDEAASWLLGSGDPGAATALMAIPPEFASTATAPAGPRSVGLKGVTHLRFEVAAGALVVRILTPTLDDEHKVAPIRHELALLFESELPRRVVLSLDGMAFLSSQAVGVILAYFQKLDRAGGALRLAQVPPRIGPVLDQMRVPALLGVYPTIDEAVDAAWD